MSKQISDKDFFSFDWPPKFITKPKQKKHYKHLAIIVSANDPEKGYVLGFSSEDKARDHIRSALRAEPKPLTKYERKELPNQTEEGIIEQ